MLMIARATAPMSAAVKPCTSKPGNNLPRKHEDECIDDKEEKAKRENAERKSNYFEQQPDGGVQESNNQDGEERVAKALTSNPGT